PTAKAWHQPYQHESPLQITTVRIRRRKNRIYRLDVAGRAGAGVIAKRCGKETALIERAVYEGLLPHAAVPSLGYHGFLEEQDGEHGWIFMDEAIGDNYSNLLGGHRAAAARWLGLIHSSVAEVPAHGPLPDGGPSRYLDILHATCESMRQHLGNPILTTDDVMLLEGIQAHLEDVGVHWNRLEAACVGAPQTLVHGDFSGKNVRLRAD